MLGLQEISITSHTILKILFIFLIPIEWDRIELITRMSFENFWSFVMPKQASWKKLNIDKQPYPAAEVPLIWGAAAEDVKSRCRDGERNRRA